MTEPKKPWDQEPTPLCDEAAYDVGDYGRKMCVDGDYVDSDFARRMERRLRHAARLLGTIRIDCMLDGPDGTLDPELLEQRLAELEETLQ